jgi:Tfp pilus assembly protein PilF
MAHDRYGLTLSTRSADAAEAYRDGVECLLTLYPGAPAAFDRAIAADPSFAMAYAGKARAEATRFDMPAARAAIATAQSLTAGVTEREASHIGFFALMLSGQPVAALDALYTHLKAWPLDALVYSTSSSPLGLIGTSGRATLKQEQLALAEALAPHYGDDWWFLPNHAFALAETGQHAPARAKVERSMADHAANAVGAHTLAHICYEDGRQAEARAFIAEWLPSYPREGFLHGHIS